MADKAKFAYGSLANLDAALQSGAVDAFDLLCLYDDGVARIGWVNKDGEPVLVDVPSDDVLVVDELPETGKTGVVYIVGEIVYIWSGTQFIVISESTDISDVKEQLASLGQLVSALEERASSIEEKATELEAEVAAKIDAEEAEAKYLPRKYEIAYKPEGTLVDYREKEIRVTAPADTEWTLQQSGENANKNMYYMGFKAYAPADVVSFKEDLAETISDDTMYYFEDNEFAGIDEFGRKYSVVWLPMAAYDETSDAWTYYGASSSAEQYIGWYYSVEWYNSDGMVIASDCIRINLANEDCHSTIEPYFMASITAEVKKYVDEQVEEVSEIPVVEF